jgi:hypothetical protein
MKLEKTTGFLLAVALVCLVIGICGCSGISTDGSAGASSGSNVELDTPAPALLAKQPGDWGATLLAGGTVGLGMYPAKFTFDIAATPSCANDYLAMNTSLAGVSATAKAARTGTFTGAAANAQTVTIGTTAATLVLTASTTLNTGLNFQTSATVATQATNLRDAIIRNGAATGVTASSAAGVVTVTALNNGSQGNLTTLAEGLSNFTWAGATLTGGLGTGNIVAFNNLYSTQGSAGGLCNQDGPSVYWSYFTGTGQALTSVVLSGDGSKLAFVENAAGGATLRILKWKSGQGSGAGYPVAPDTTLAAGQNWTSNCPAGNSCVRGIAFNGSFQDTNSPPFYNYNTDTLYVGDDSSRLHKFTGVFNGTPAEVTTGWPIQINGTAKLTGAVYDSVSGNIYVGDNTGRLSFVREVGSTVGSCASGSPPCLGSVNLAIGTAGAVVDAPVVDGSTGRVIAVNGTETSLNGIVVQASTALTGAVSFNIGGTSAGTGAMYSGAFDNTYINSAPPSISGHMYLCGNDNAHGSRPALYQLSFNGSGVLTGVGTALVNLVSAGSGGGSQSCSPVTEVYNPNVSGGAKDWIFFATADHANTVNPIPAGSTCRTDALGCLISIDVTGNPTWPPTVVTNARSMPTNPAGATSGIVVDNVSSSSQTSNIYLTLGVNSVATSPCNTTTGVGCAIKLTQAALQ